MTIDEAIYCLKSYLPNNEVNMCQKCKYYGSANENESGFIVLTCQSHMAHLMAIKALEEQQWIPCSERLPDEEFVEGLENGTIYNLYPLLVTRYATHSPVDPKRLYVAKHYYDGNDFVNNGGEECTEAVIAWMPLPEPYEDGGGK